MLKDLPNNSMNTDTQQPLATRLLLAGYTHHLGETHVTAK